MRGITLGGLFRFLVDGRPSMQPTCSFRKAQTTLPSVWQSPITPMRCPYFYNSTSQSNELPQSTPQPSTRPYRDPSLWIHRDSLWRMPFLTTAASLSPPRPRFDTAALYGLLLTTTSDDILRSE